MNLRITKLESLINQKEDKTVVAMLDEKKADWALVNEFMTKTDHRLNDLETFRDNINHSVTMHNAQI